MKVAHHEPKHPKQDFQVERIAFFSDAVYAIAITLLVIEFKAPEVTRSTSESELWHELLGMKYKFASVLLSFSLIVNYWIRHHGLFKHVHDYNRKIVMANMLSLLPIIFFPFTTSFLYESLGVNEAAAALPYQLFVLNNIFAGISLYYFYWLVMKIHPSCSYPMEEAGKNDFERKLLVLTGSMLLVFLISFISMKHSIWGLLPAAFLNLRNRFATKTKKQQHAK